MSPFASVGLRRASVLAVAFFLLTCARVEDKRDLFAAMSTAQFRLTAAALPLSFEGNTGQADPRVKFLSRGRGYTLFLTEDEAVLSFEQSGVETRNSKFEIRKPVQDWPLGAAGSLLDSRLAAPGRQAVAPSVLRLRMLGANPAAAIVALDPLPGRSNYFIGNDPKKWHTHVPTYARVRYKGIYPGVDLSFYGRQDGQLEYDFDLAPGADPSAIRLAMDAEGGAGSRQKAVGRGQSRRPGRASNYSKRTSSSADQVGYLREAKYGHARSKILRIAPDGDLVVTLPGGGEMRFHRPVVYQGESTVDSRQPTGPIGNPKFRIQDSKFERRTTDDGQQTSSNPKSQIQNPKFIEARYALTPDGVVTIAIAPYDRTHPLVVDPVLIYSTYLGGSDMDYANGIAVDASGNAYVTGYTASVDFPVLNAVQATPGGGSCSEDGTATACFDAFVSKLNSSGTALLYSTYLGGSDEDYGAAIAVDSSGDAYVAGYTYSTNFPVENPLQPDNAGGVDAFVAELSPDGSSLIYSTYWGGSLDDVGTGIAVDSKGNAFLSGYTESTNFPVSSGAFQTTFGGGAHNAFVVKFDPGGAQLGYSTYLGGSGDDYAYAAAVDSASGAYVTGATNSINFPTLNAFQRSYTGGECAAESSNPFPCFNVFVAKLNPAGSALSYATYLGGTGGDYGYAIGLDSSANAYVTGYTTSQNFPTTSGAFQQTPANSYTSYDVFVSKLNSSGSTLGYSTYLGGSGTQVAYGIAVDSNGSAYLTGYNYGGNFPTANPVQAQNAGFYDAFVSVLNPSGSALSFSTYLGGSQDDFGRGIALGPSGNVYVAGATFSTDFPITSGSFETSYMGGPYDAFVTMYAASALPAVAISPTSYNFGNQAVGTTSSPETITLSNNGSVTLTISSIAISGDFSQTNTCGSSLAANSSCSINVTFTPTASGSRTGSVTITDNANPTTQTVSLSGTGATPVASLSATSLTFSAQAVGTSSSPQSVTLSNTGNAALTISSIAISGDFSQTNTCGSSLAANSSCSINVTFTPTASGSRTGSITITDNANPATQTVSLSGTGAAPVASLSPTSLTFPTLPLGLSSAPQSVTLKNTGTGNLVISSLSVSGDFSQTNTCGSSVAAGASCTVSVTFKPTASGLRTGTLTIADNASPATQTASLTGTGAGAGATLSPSSLTFAAQALGTSSSPQTVILQNTGTALLTISNISITGDFSQTHTCGTLLIVGASCTLSVTFDPTASGTRTGVLTLTDNAIPSTQTVSLTGAGGGPAASLSATSLTFASQAVGTSSNPQTLTLTNTGSATLTLSSITISGDFSQANTCGPSVAAGGACSMSVTFTPTQSGTRTGTLTITDNASPATQTVSLTGTGSGGPAVSLSPASLTFAAQVVGSSSSSPQTSTLTNTGNATLTISSISISSNFFQTDNCASSLAAGASCTINVTFQPTVSGPISGTLTITDNASPATQTVSLSGTGTGPAATLSPASLQFPAQAVGSTSSPQAVTLENTGTAPLSITGIAISGNFAQTNTCGSSLAAGASCGISVTFTATASGTSTGTVTVTDNASPSTQTVSLSGTGTAGSPAVNLSPSYLVFGTQTVGTTSNPQTASLTNIGGATLSISSIQTSSYFSETNNCGSTLAPNSSCTISVTFKPIAVGPSTGKLTVTDNATPATQTVILTGDGFPSTSLLLAPAALTFAAQTVGAASSPQTVTVSNTGNAVLSFASIMASGDSVQSNNCGSIVAVNASCTLSVAFRPSAAGARSGAVTLTDGANGSPQVVTITGSGEDFVLAAQAGSSTSASVSPGGAATFSLNILPVGGFNQSVTFSCAGAPAEAQCAVSPASISLSNSTNFTVTVATTAPSLAPLQRRLPPPGPGQPPLWLLWALALVSSGTFAAALRNRAEPRTGGTRGAWVVCLALWLATLAVAACGGGSGTSAPAQTNPGTPQGAYALTVTGACSSCNTSLSHSINLSLQVQ